MKILFIINEFGNGGRERRLVELIRALDKSKDYTMCALISNKAIEYREIESTSCSIICSCGESAVKRFKELEKVVKEFHPDIIHLWIETGMYCVAIPWISRKYNCKYIAGFVADGNSLSCMPYYLRPIMKYTFKKADAIVSNSKAGLEAKKAPFDKSYIIYNGFDQNRLSKISSEQKRRELGIKTNYIVTMCGRMETAKDWDSFVLLAEKSQYAGDDITFLAVCGRGDLLDYYLKLVREKNLKNIQFLSCRSDVMEIMAATDVSVLFTNNKEHAEGVSNSIMESMAAGAPVIATAGGGTAEIITSSKDGYIVSPKNVDEAYNRLHEILYNRELRVQMGRIAENKVKERFSLNRMAEEYKDLYNKLLYHKNK